MNVYMIPSREVSTEYKAETRCLSIRIRDPYYCGERTTYDFNYYMNARDIWDMTILFYYDMYAIIFHDVDEKLFRKIAKPFLQQNTREIRLELQSPHTVFEYFKKKLTYHKLKKV